MKNHPVSNLTVRWRLFLSAVLLALITFAFRASAATIVWSGASGVDTNWSSAANWTGGLPGSGDDVKFFDAGTNALGVINNVVDAGTTISSLHYGNTNNSHATFVGAGQTLTVNGNLAVYSAGDPGAVRNLTNIITGPDGALVVNNGAAVLSINQACNNFSGANRGTLNMSGLGTFTATARGIGIGTTIYPNVVAQKCGGLLILARTNYISLGLTDTLANYETSTARTNAIEISRNPGNNPGISSGLLLGLTNYISLDSVSCGLDKSGNNSTPASGFIAFNPVFTNDNPGAVFRGIGGGTARVKWWSIGDGNNSSSSSNGGRGTNDFSNGTVDLLVDVMSLGRECNAANTGWAGPHSGLLTFNRGVIDVNTVYAGNQPFNRPTSVPGAVGIIIVGANAQLRVNNALHLGYTTVSSTTALRTSGTLNIQGGTAYVNQINVGTISVTNNLLMNGGTLVLSNTIASPAKGLLTFASTNATLQLNVTGVTNIVTTNLVVGGSSNVISAPSVAVFSSYPRQVPLIKYTTLTGTFNFVLDSNTLAASAPGAYLSNNVANSSVDLVLPTDPRPVITSTPNNFAGAPGIDVTLATTYTGVAPLTAQWLKNNVALTDGPTGSGSILAGVSTPTLTITNAQDTDSGSYVIVVTNIFGAATSTPPASVTISTNDIAPIITGPFNQTVIQGNDATFTASVSGNPAPFIQWQKNGTDITGENSANLTITNAQYPADQATYSIIATNAAGAVTNSATLTVIVAPAISAQPVDVIVTNGQPASFAVTATGVPAPTYQWRKNGSPIANQTNATLSFGAVTPADIASYSVVIQNAAGSATSTNAALYVYSTMGVSTLAPSNNATGLCWDTPLYVTFGSAPTLRTPGTGKIRIYNSTNPATPVDTLDMSANATPHPTYGVNVQARTIGTLSVATYPVIITGNTAAIYPRPGAMTSNQTYYVTVDAGVFTDSAGAWHAGINDTNAWRFATKPAVSPNAVTNPVVNADGSGDFVTIQGALDYLPASGPDRRLVEIRNGTYTELVVIAKSNVTLRGQSRLGARQQYYNNSWVNASTRGRMSLHVKAPDVAIESMSLTNLTPKGGSQAEALFLESGSTAAKRFIMLNCVVSSYQDTILGNDADTPAYFANSLVQGDTDYIWGGATMFFTNCELRMLSTGGMYANPSSSAGSNGIAFVGCKLTRDPSVTSGFLGRTRSILNGNTAFINCNADSHVGGWNPDALPTNSFRIWHYGISNLTATVNRDASITNSILLTAGDPRLTLALDATNWLYGWVPQLAPNILTNPASATVTAGQPASFNVTATGIPDPTYQWLKDGTNITDATNATYAIPATVLSDAGSYQVVVTTTAGSVTSSAATLTVNAPPNSAPTFTGPIAGTNINVNPGVELSLTNSATDSDVPAQTLTYTLLTGPTNVSINAASGVLTWRPLVTQADSVNPISVAVTDDGTPALSATNNYSITVGSLAPIGLASAMTTPGQLTLTVTAGVGPDYAVEASTNLTSWSTLFITNSPPSPFSWDVTNTAATPMQFFRIKAGPPLP